MEQQMSRRALLVRGAGALAGASAVAGALGGAARAGALRGLNSTAAVAKRTFTYWYVQASQAQGDWLKKYDFALFDQTHPNLHVDAQLRPNPVIDRLIATALKAGRAPDLIQTPGASYATTYANAGYLLPLDKYIAQHNWKSKILPWALKSGAYRGHYYSVPASYETLVIYYNKTLFKKKGYKIPTNRGELEALCTELAGQGITPFMAGNQEWKPATEWHVSMFLNHYAGPTAIYDALAGKRKWTDPVFVDAIELMASWFQKGWFGGGVDRYFTNRFAPQYADFGAGKAAMDMEGSWGLISMSDYFGAKGHNTNEWDWFPVPPLSSHAPKNLYALATGQTLSINAKAKDPDAVAEYLNWEFSTPERSGQRIADLGDEPYPIHLAPKDFPASTDKRFSRMYSSIGKATAKGTFGYTTWTFWGPKSDVWSYQGMDKVLTKGQSAKAYLSQMQTLMDAERTAKQLPPLIPQGPLK